MLAVAAPVIAVNSIILVAVVSTTTVAVVTEPISLAKALVAIAPSSLMLMSPSMDPVAPFVRTVFQESTVKGCVVTLALLAAATDAVILPDKELVPIRMRNVTLPGEVLVVVLQPAWMWKVLPATSVLAGMLRPTICVSELTIAPVAAVSVVVSPGEWPRKFNFAVLSPTVPFPKSNTPAESLDMAVSEAVSCPEAVGENPIPTDDPARRDVGSTSTRVVLLVRKLIIPTAPSFRITPLDESNRKA